MNGYVGAFHNWFEKNFTFKGAAVLLIWIAKSVPDIFGRADFWSKNIGWVWHRIYDHSTISVTILCGLLIWLDHRRVIAKSESKPHDLKTLRGRTFKLRDDIKTFFDSLGAEVDPKRQPGETQPGWLRRVGEDNSLRISKLIHGYELRFAPQVVRTYHEYGELGINDVELWKLICIYPKNQDCYKEIISTLGKLADQHPVTQL